MQRRSVGLGVRSTLFTRNYLAFACTAFAISFVGYKCDVVEGQASTTISQEACPAVAGCMNDTLCSECVSALMSNVAEDEANPFISPSTQKDFFMSLVGPTCFRNGTIVPLLSAAADEIFNLPCHSMGLNWPRLPVNDLCLSVEFNCALNPDCRQCLQGIYTSENKSGELSSPSCGALGVNGLFDLSVCALQTCTLAKQECADDATLNCPVCLDLMRNGDVASALQRCSSSLASQCCSPRQRGVLLHEQHRLDVQLFHGAMRPRCGVRQLLGGYRRGADLARHGRSIFEFTLLHVDFRIKQLVVDPSPSAAVQSFLGVSSDRVYQVPRVHSLLLN